MQASIPFSTENISGQGDLLQLEENKRVMKTVRTSISDMYASAS